MRLKVTRRSHTHRGKTYFPGEEFDGTEKLMMANPDRLAPVREAEDVPQSAPDAKPEVKTRRSKRKGHSNADASGSK